MSRPLKEVAKGASKAPRRKARVEEEKKEAAENEVTRVVSPQAQAAADEAAARGGVKRDTALQLNGTGVYSFDRVKMLAGDPTAGYVYFDDTLRRAKVKVVVCDPRKNRLLQDGNKSDKVDARKLAQLLRAGLLSPVYHGEQGVRDLRELVRSYEYLVEDSTGTMNRIKALYRSRAIACAGTETYKPRQREAWLGKLPRSGAQDRGRDSSRAEEWL